MVLKTGKMATLVLDRKAKTPHLLRSGGIVRSLSLAERWGSLRSLCSMQVAGALAAAALFCASTPARSQAMTEVRAVPVDCRDLKEVSGQSGMQSWQAFVRMEHCDRIKRLVRLSATLPPNRRPIFFEGIVPSSRLPAGFDVDVPVLRVVFPDHVFFDTAESKLRPEAELLVEIIAESLRREPPDVALFVAGHADKRGDNKYNEALSIDRANALAETIYDRGVAYSSIWRIGFGEDMPLLPGDDQASLDQNRRIEFLFAAKPEAVGVWMADQQLAELCQARDKAEAERCKSQLNLKRDYEAVEIVARPKARIDPQSSSATMVKPSHPKMGLTPSGARGQHVQPGAAEVVGISPTPSRRMRIDPVLRKATPVRVDL